MLANAGGKPWSAVSEREREQCWIELADPGYDPREDEDFVLAIEGAERAEGHVDVIIEPSGGDVARGPDDNTSVPDARSDGQPTGTQAATANDDSPRVIVASDGADTSGRHAAIDQRIDTVARRDEDGVLGSPQVASPRPPPEPAPGQQPLRTDDVPRKRSAPRRSTNNAPVSTTVVSGRGSPNRGDSTSPMARQSPQARREAGWRGVEGDVVVKQLLERTPMRPPPGNAHPTQPINFDLEAPGLVGPLTLDRGRAPVPPPGAPPGAATRRRASKPDVGSGGDGDVRELLAQRERELASLKQQYDAMVGRRPQKRATGRDGIHEHVAELRKTVTQAVSSSEVCARCTQLLPCPLFQFVYLQHLGDLVYIRHHAHTEHRTTICRCCPQHCASLPISLLVSSLAHMCALLSAIDASTSFRVHRLNTCTHRPSRLHVGTLLSQH